MTKYVIAMAMLGLGFALATVGLLFGYTNDLGILYLVAQKNPPWTVLSGLAAAPCLILLWIKRNDHREQDVATAQKQQALSHFSEALRLFGGSEGTDVERIGGLHALHAVALSAPETYARAVRETLIAFVEQKRKIDSTCLVLLSKTCVT